MNDFSLYVHIPFCISKCRYCDFVSAPPRSDSRIDDYFKLIEKEILLLSITPHFRAASLSTIFFGGGTPSLAGADRITKLLATIKKHFDISPDAEISIEANPASVKHPAKWAGEIEAAGVTRVVVGLQSMHDDELELLGRPYHVDEALSFYKTIRAAGFNSVGIDLIYGLPGRDVNKWRECLRRAIALDPHHVSAYCLEVHEKTPLGKDVASGKLPDPDPDFQAAMYDVLRTELAMAGYEMYEISNFAKPGKQCRHNLVYWRGGEYAGVGIAACSFAGAARYSNECDHEKYAAKLAAGMLPLAYGERLSTSRSMRERAIMALRTARGLRIEEFVSHYGVIEAGKLKKDLDNHVKNGFLKTVGQGGYALAADSYFISDSVFQMIVG